MSTHQGVPRSAESGSRWDPAAAALPSQEHCAQACQWCLAAWLAGGACCSSPFSTTMCAAAPNSCAAVRALQALSGVGQLRWQRALPHLPHRGPVSAAAGWRPLRPYNMTQQQFCVIQRSSQATLLVEYPHRLCIKKKNKKAHSALLSEYLSSFRTLLFWLRCHEPPLTQTPWPSPPGHHWAPAFLLPCIVSCPLPAHYISL